MNARSSTSFHENRALQLQRWWEKQSGVSKKSHSRPTWRLSRHTIIASKARAWAMLFSWSAIVKSRRKYQSTQGMRCQREKAKEVPGPRPEAEVRQDAALPPQEGDNWTLLGKGLFHSDPMPQLAEKRINLAGAHSGWNHANTVPCTEEL